MENRLAEGVDKTVIGRENAELNVCQCENDVVDETCSLSDGITCRDGSIDVCVQRSWQMLAGESPAVVKVGQPLSQ